MHRIDLWRLESDWIGLEIASRTHVVLWAFLRSRNSVAESGMSVALTY